MKAMRVTRRDNYVGKHQFHKECQMTIRGLGSGSDERHYEEGQAKLRLDNSAPALDEFDYEPSQTKAFTCAEALRNLPAHTPRRPGRSEKGSILTEPGPVGASGPERSELPALSTRPTSIPRLGRRAILERQEISVAWQRFHKSAKHYSEALLPGADALRAAALREGLAHVLWGSKPAYYDGDARYAGRLVRLLERVDDKPGLSDRYKVLTSGASDDMLLVLVNRTNLQRTIKRASSTFGIQSAEDLEHVVSEICDSNDIAWLVADPVKLGVILGYGEQNAVNFSIAQTATPWNATESEEEAIRDKLGSRRIYRAFETVREQFDLLDPLPNVGMVWDSQETAALIRQALDDTASINRHLGHLHACALARDPDARYADTLIEALLDTLFDGVF